VSINTLAVDISERRKIEGYCSPGGGDFDAMLVCTDDQRGYIIVFSPFLKRTVCSSGDFEHENDARIRLERRVDSSLD
jgi:hypothetical protein